MTEQEIYKMITEIVKEDVNRCKEIGFNKFKEEMDKEYQDMMNFMMGDKNE